MATRKGPDLNRANLTAHKSGLQPLRYAFWRGRELSPYKHDLQGMTGPNSRFLRLATE